MSIRKGDKVDLKVNGQKVTGTVASDPVPTILGPSVNVDLDSKYSHLLPTGSTSEVCDALTKRR